MANTLLRTTITTTVCHKIIAAVVIAKTEFYIRTYVVIHNLWLLKRINFGFYIGDILKETYKFIQKENFSLVILNFS